MINTESKILIVGAGSSSSNYKIGLSEELYDDGYTNITNIDYSPSVVQFMQEKFKDKEISIQCN